jgi:hypothetical protein
MSLSLPILNRTRQWGYIFWNLENDLAVRDYLKGFNELEILFEDKNLGKKKVDWKFRRISIGPAVARNIPPTKSEFVLSLNKGGGLVVKCQ